jgi:hypothetical protein
MALRLAHDPIELSHGDLTVRLRPSLRAGYLLSRKYSIGRIHDALRDSSVTILTDIILAGTDDSATARNLIGRKIADDGVLSLTAFSQSIVNFLAHSLGLNTADEEESETEKAATSGKTVDFADALAGLYETGTGWLGWTPADTWAATPAEIIAARNGLFDKLKAIHGSADDEDSAPTPAPIPTEEQVRANIADLKAMTGGKF